MSRFGLKLASCGIHDEHFAINTGTALQVADRLNALGVMLNNHTAFRYDWIPYDRWQSGLGVGGKSAGIGEMTQKQKMRVVSYSAHSEENEDCTARAIH